MTPETLVLVPTQFELDSLRRSDPSASPSLRFAICGFGPVAAACRTMQLLCASSYRRVLLCGLAGTYTDALRIGEVVTFSSVTIDGVGAMEKGCLRSGNALGFDTSVPDRIEGIESHPQVRCAEGLLTVCICSGSAEQAAGRRASHPDVVAEDMEGYGVAMACRLQNVPLTIVRSISNRAGDRDKRNWRIDDALDAMRSVFESTTS